MSNTIYLEKGYFAKKNSLMSVEQRIFYFILGFGLTVSVLAATPVSTAWIAALSLVGVGLVMMSIIGRRLFATRLESGLKLEGRQVTNTITAVGGIGASVLAIAMPPESTALAAMVHGFGILLVIHAILNSNVFTLHGLRGRTYTLAKNKFSVKSKDTYIDKAA